MIIELKPLDTLFFRDGKPFNKGYETVADTIFPPFPATIYGALRTAFFDNNISKFQELLHNKSFNTENDPTTKLKINNILIKSNDSDYLFTTPKNMLTCKDDNQSSVIVIDKLNTTNLSNCQLSGLVNETEKNYKYHNSYLDELSFEYYLEKDYSKITNTKSDTIFDVEPKIGIALDNNTNTAKDSNLYRIDLVRLKDDIVLQVDFEGLELPDNFVMKLGGEGKFVSAKQVETSWKIKAPDIDDKFIIYLNTPAIFKNGWLPGWVDESDYTGIIPNTDIKVKLLTANIGKPLLIGGFDMATRKPKPMFKAVPTGSVYFFKIISGNPLQLNQIHQTSISDYYPEQGFGTIYIGKL